MNVLYIIDYGTVGGATHSFLEMVFALRELGVTPIVCTSRDSSINEYLNGIGIRNVSIGHKTVLEPFSFKSIRGVLKFPRKIISFYRGEKKALQIIDGDIDFSQIDIVHTNSARNDIGCYVNMKYGTPHVMHIREFADLDFNCISFRRNYISIFNNFTTRFISISDAVKRHWAKKGIESNKIETIYNGIHFEDISVSSDNDKKDDLLRFVIVGGVYKTKGQHIAVEAMTKLPEEIRKKVSLDIIGWYGSRYIPSFMKKAKECGIESQIIILGSKNDVHQRLGNYQIGLMCSRAEGFGRTTAEYMHARLGVIASDSGANPELIEDGVTGLLFKSGDAKSLADCIVRLYKDRELLVRLSNAAQEKARKCYTQQKNAESIYNLYNEILNNK